MSLSGWTRRGRSLTATPLLCWLAACGGQAPEVGLPAPFAATELQRINSASRGFAPTSAGFVVEPGRDSWVPDSLTVALPYQATAPVLMHASGLTLEVRETGVSGDAEQQGGLVRYRRDNGQSFWASGRHGVEEWVLLPQGIDDAQIPAASWVVAGGALVQDGAVVVVADPLTRKPRLRVKADRAYGPDGQPLGVQLRVVGDRIDLHVEVSAGPVLVDPLWIDLASLNEGRFSHAATLLQDGTVLASGGIGAEVPPDAISTAEIYDPLLVLWSPVNSMFDIRESHTLTTLDDGRALAHGGDNGFGFPASCPEWWDPGTSNWMTPSSGGCSICFTAGHHTATKLADGTVLMTGGQEVSVPEAFGTSGGFGSSSCAEIFDPSFDGYINANDMIQQRLDHQAVRLANDDVLVTGGEHFGSIQSSAETYNRGGDSWTSIASMNVARTRFTLTRLCNDRILAAGGQGFGGVQANAEVYNPATDTWTNTGAMTQPRTGHTANLLPLTCRVLVVGGFDDNGNPLDTAELYDPTTNAWTATDPITDVRAFGTGTTLVNGNVLVAGGYDGVDSVGSSMVYQPFLPLGAGCVVGVDCESGNCADGVCCDLPCTGTCQACTTAYKGGGLNGTCEDVDQGLDPHTDCAGMGAATCGTTGACDGSGACEVYSAGTVCVVVGCQGNDLREADTCNGGGSCIDNGVTDCALYSCSAGACLTSCTVHSDCDQLLAYCDVGGACVTLKALGENATDPAECASGIIADNVCCDTACDLGVCDSCSTGTCESTVGDCGDGNDCTNDTCDPAGMPGLECLHTNKQDGLACEAGICVAGNCVPDAIVSSGGNGGTAGAGGGSGGAGGESSGTAGNALGDPRLEGGGLCNASVAGGRHREAPAWLLLALGVALRRRTRRSAS